MESLSMTAPGGSASAASLASRMQMFPVTVTDSAALAKLAGLETDAAGRADLTILRVALTWPGPRSVLLAVFAGSPYLTALATRDLERLQRILSASPDDHLEGVLTALMAAAMDPSTTQMSLMRDLRRAKAEIALATALADLSGVWPVMTVTAALTRLADTAAAASVRFLFREGAIKGDWRPANPAAPEAGSG
ncbi:MAG: bifunctional [glutamine synthetase] adenylyltransferase/[glutamine synthetase]-adenylyl-L-tyrosine phosphorylase, partial [Hyphomicrobiaceae bacterium]|nr:bifunctional [glutamine synthetase] adenylyltransferase/[glutamine synthetase]-adenylyl-L-tyrosine phosphorylase [Hyphomicrobiaceae bacterium]